MWYEYEAEVIRIQWNFDFTIVDLISPDLKIYIPGESYSKFYREESRFYNIFYIPGIIVTMEM